MARFFYNLALLLLLSCVGLHLLLRSGRQPEYLRHVGERFGRYGFNAGQPLIWLHAVSVGETRAAQPLVTALKARYPGHRILLTHMTPTGRQASEELFGDGNRALAEPGAGLQGAGHSLAAGERPPVGEIGAALRPLSEPDAQCTA